jgi:hypothetical protein
MASAPEIWRRCLNELARDIVALGVRRLHGHSAADAQQRQLIDEHSVKERDAMKKALAGSAALLLFAAAGDVLAAGSSSTTADQKHCYLFGMVPKDSPHALLHAAATGTPPVDHYFQFMANGRTDDEVKDAVASYGSGLPKGSMILQSQGNVGYVGIIVDDGQPVHCECPVTPITRLQ